MYVRPGLLTRSLLVAIGLAWAPAPAAADAGVPPVADAGVSPVVDAGVSPVEAGVSPVDAGARATRTRRDAGPTDAGTIADGGVDGDAGLDADAGVDGDAGVDDAGVADDQGVDGDAGVDAGVAAPAEGPAMPTPEELTIALEQRTADAPVVESEPAAPPGSAETTLFALKLIFGLAVLLALAYLGGHPRTLRLQERIGIRGVILAGFPFVAIGVIASLPSVGILTDEVLPKLRPVLQFGLGWIGFIVGAHLDIRVLDRVPRGSAYLILIEAIVPFAVTAAVCGAVMVGAFDLSASDPAVWRDVVLLGTAAAMTAPRRFHGLANQTWREGKSADVLLGQLDEIAGIVGLLFIMAYFRGEAEAGTWQLPGTAWLFVAVGLGVVIGVVIFATIRLPRSNAEFLAIVLGVVAFASGLASVLRLSSVVTCFICGVLVTNFPNEQRDSVFRILNRLERPIHLLFLMIAGAVWNVFDWRGWVLVPLFVVCRVLGKWLGIVTSRFTLRSVLPAAFTERRTLVVPMSTMAIALVVSIERFRDVGLSWVVTAVIGGAIAFELLVPRLEDDDDEAPGAPRSGEGATPPEKPQPIDELDDDRGPVYDRDDATPPPGNRS